MEQLTMKTIEINGQTVLAVNVPKDALDVCVDENTLEWSTPSRHWPDWCYIPHHNYTIIADSGEPEKFVNVWYPDAKVVVSKGAFARGVIGGCKVLTPIIDTETEAWQSAASRIMQEYGLEGRVILLKK